MAVVACAEEIRVFVDVAGVIQTIQTSSLEPIFCANERVDKSLLERIEQAASGTVVHPCILQPSGMRRSFFVRFALAFHEPKQVALYVTEMTDALVRVVIERFASL